MVEMTVAEEVEGMERAREIAGGRETGREAGVSGKAPTAPVSRLFAHNSTGNQRDRLH